LPGERPGQEIQQQGEAEQDQHGAFDLRLHPRIQSPSPALRVTGDGWRDDPSAHEEHQGGEQ